MKAFNVHFPDKQHLQVADLVGKSKLKQSQVARAAMQLGLKRLRESEDLMKDVLLNDAKALN